MYGEDDRRKKQRYASVVYIKSILANRYGRFLQEKTIRKNKRSVSTVEGSSSHLNRTKSSHSNNVESASNMIPCFHASNGTDAHYCDTISNRSSPSQFTKHSPSNTSQDSTRPTTNNFCHCFENCKGYYLRNSDWGECSFCSLSQDD